MSEEVSKRSIAEARRQKLLARGKDRLQQITQGQPQSELRTPKLGAYLRCELPQS